MDFTKLLQCEETAEWTKQLAARFAPYPYLTDAIAVVSSLAIGAILASGLYFVLDQFLLRFYRRHCRLNEDLLRCISKMSFSLVSCLPIMLVAYCVWIDGIHEWVAVTTRELMRGLSVLALASAATSAIRSFGLWYKQQRNAAQRPIDGLLNVAVGFVWTGTAILFFSILLGKSPLYLLSGLGAMAAVLLLIFQPSILSLVASVRVNTNHLVEIGDWIILESDGADGQVKEISLHTVKVRNWDKTLVSLPVCDLVNKAFVNCTAMQRLGGRRIKKSIIIDQRSIRFLSKDEVKELKGFDILKDYLNGKEEEITTYNTGRTRYNTRHLTNLGTFRVYAQHYLERLKSIRDDMTLIVRVQAPTSSGVPLEIICFCREVEWIPFEKVQSAVLEHLLAVLPNFRLRVFQNCSDIYQEIGSQIDVVGGAFRFDKFTNPRYPRDVTFPNRTPC